MLYVCVCVCVLCVLYVCRVCRVCRVRHGDVRGEPGGVRATRSRELRRRHTQTRCLRPGAGVVQVIRGRGHTELRALRSEHAHGIPPFALFRYASLFSPFLYASLLSLDMPLLCSLWICLLLCY